ncbi:MAG: flagellar hook-length control protein FliK [Delftia acidovorans]|jgi:flagellar hook-length control protein FliK|uniref:flagellar hook-length control protein FliK n=1 Tax=Delftia acidovorans TaxID=80866 RepID=UPI00283A65B7|nr:flagellar hook-length control protein FliK [Delftia acidovorans]MDR3019058.1 flagellar hook-length control protein FliK [Delftia acidovorans]
MSTNQIEQRADARSAMQRAMEGVRSARGTQPPSNDQAAGFSSLLAAMDGIGGLPALASDALGQALGEDGSAALSALSSLKGAAKDGLKDAADLLADPGLAQGLLQQPQLPLQPQAKPTDMTTSAQADAMALAANGQAPWLSLVGQTAHLDGKGDRDMLQGVAGDWLSGRGSAAMMALRQEQGAVAHAAFLAPQSAAGDAAGTALATAGANAAALAAAADPNAAGTLTDGAARSTQAQAQAADVLAAVQSDAALTAAAARTATTAQATHEHMPQALAAGVRQDVALAAGIALNGMAAVRPEEWRGLFERAREGATASAESAANGLHGVAAAVGAAHAGQSLGQQAAGQNGAAFAQPDAQAQPGNSTEREQQVSEQVAFWVHNKNQNASLSVEHEGKAIQVQVSLQGNEAHVRFGASEAQARDWLGNGADQLRELLQAQGLQLAGVSVDAGGQSGSGDSGRQGADAQARQGRVSAMVDAAGVTGGNGAAQAGGGRAAAGGVDLFV